MIKRYLYAPRDFDVAPFERAAAAGITIKTFSLDFTGKIEMKCPAPHWPPVTLLSTVCVGGNPYLASHRPPRFRHWLLPSSIYWPGQKVMADRVINRLSAIVRDMARTVVRAHRINE